MAIAPPSTAGPLSLPESAPLEEPARDQTSDEHGSCAHCELPVRVRAGTPADAELFCCVGCRLAHAVAGKGAASGLLEARLLVAAILSMGVMTFSLVLHSIDLHASGDEQGLVALVSLGRAALALLALPVLVLLAPPLAAGAAADLRNRRVRMDGLIVLGAGAAYALSLVHAWRGEGAVYFDTAAMVLVLVTFGRRLEAHARHHAATTAQALADVLPASARRLGDDDASELVDPLELAPGDRVQVAPGETVPADARVLRGRSALLTASLTGEQLPRAVGPGDEAPAGAINTDGALQLEVRRAATEGSLAHLRRLLEAPLAMAPALRTADRLAGALAALAITLALVGGLRDGLSHDAARGLRTALSVLLVACPCALGLATPLAYRAARAALARRGVLVNDAGALERAARVDHVVFDKTGTLTEPLGQLQPLAGSDAEVWRRARALIAGSGHALARAVGNPERAEVRELAVANGRGVSGLVDGHRLRVGRLDWVLQACAPGASRPLRAALEEAAADGATVVAVAADTELRAGACLRQQLRPSAEASLAELAALGLHAEILSGDAEPAVAALGAELGIPASGALSPEAKHELLLSRRAAGATVLMVGDGMNDAPALRLADVGVALAGGTSLARARADVELVGDDLRGLLVLLQGSHKLRATVRGNLAWTLLYNAGALALAFSGHLPPLAAVAAMIASSLVVSWRSQRLLSWKPLQPQAQEPGAEFPALSGDALAEGTRA